MPTSPRHSDVPSIVSMPVLSLSSPTSWARSLSIRSLFLALIRRQADSRSYLDSESQLAIRRVVPSGLTMIGPRSSNLRASPSWNDRTVPLEYEMPVHYMMPRVLPSVSFWGGGSMGTSSWDWTSAFIGPTESFWGEACRECLAKARQRSSLARCINREFVLDCSQRSFFASSFSATDSWWTISLYL